MEEACADIKESIYVLRDKLQGVQLPAQLRTKLNEFNEKQRTKLKRKLQNLCENSPWKEAGNSEIITIITWLLC